MRFIGVFLFVVSTTVQAQGFWQGMNQAQEDQARIEQLRIENERLKIDLERARHGEWVSPNRSEPPTPRCRNETYIINGIAMKCRICGQTTTCDQAN